MPPGGAGLYFFYISFRIANQERAVLSITKNGGEVCRSVTDFDNAGSDTAMGSCGTIQLLVEGSNFRLSTCIISVLIDLLVLM